MGVLGTIGGILLTIVVLVGGAFFLLNRGTGGLLTVPFKLLSIPFKIFDDLGLGSIGGIIGDVGGSITGVVDDFTDIF